MTGLLADLDDQEGKRPFRRFRVTAAGETRAYLIPLAEAAEFQRRAAQTASPEAHAALAESLGGRAE
jgi:hypothetical protein